MEKSTDIKYAIRSAKLSDAEQITQLCFQLGYPSSKQEVEYRLNSILPDNKQVIGIAVSEQNVIVGWVHALRVVYLESAPFVEIGGLVVDQNLRGRGIGKALIQFVEHWAKSIRLLEIRLRSNIIRTEAHQFYERIGFDKVKTQYTYYKILD